ncbi:MAG: dihydropteroate synthase [Candidatus Dormibacteraeota bacterium]|nr:dihydropteroate synthase [Candidatus Dormibacteraeota bacterium]
MPQATTVVPLARGLGPEGPWARLRLCGLPLPATVPPGCRIEVEGEVLTVTAGSPALRALARGSAAGSPRASLLRVAAAMEGPPRALRLGGRSWRFGARTYLLGVVNVTPDSFSGDGVGDSLEAALARGRQLVAEGADALDVGGESSRPGHQPVPVEEELRRVRPAVAALAGELGVPVFVDTWKSEVAAAALEAGASAVNDIWGLRRDRRMARVAAAAGAAVICMHNQEGVRYADLQWELSTSLQESVELAVRAGVQRSQVVLDPGIGFGKTPAQSLSALRLVPLLKLLGYPLLVGTSRKSLVGWLLGDRPVGERLMGTAATVAWAASAGADIVRVHDVAEIRDVLRVVDRLERGQTGAGA